MASAQSSAERQLNLFIALYVASRYLTKAEIRDLIESYRDKSDEAFDRMFERDKADLASIGVHVETGSVDAYFDDEIGYRIRPESVELEPIELSPEEVAVLGAARRVWTDGHRAAKTLAGLHKLELGTHLGLDEAAGLVIEPRLAGADPALDAVFEAIRDRRELHFGYQRADGRHGPRRVHPWSLFNHRDRWYVTGFDLDRQDARVFRLSRMSAGSADGVRVVGEPGTYRIPDDADDRRTASILFEHEPSGTAVVRIRRDRGLALRRAAVRIDPCDEDWDEARVPYVSAAGLAAQAAGLGGDAVVTEPQDVRDRVVALLQKVAQP